MEQEYGISVGREMGEGMAPALAVQGQKEFLLQICVCHPDCGAPGAAGSSTGEAKQFGQFRHKRQSYKSLK